MQKLNRTNETKRTPGKKNIAASCLVLGLASTTFASSVYSADASKPGLEPVPGAYYGVGIGSIVGTILAGPPGALAGAALGGVFSWGDEQKDAYLETKSDLERQSKTLASKEQDLNKRNRQLRAMQARIDILANENAMQTARISELLGPQVDTEMAELTAILEDVAQHYTQEFHFRKGESDLPGHVSGKLDELSKFLAAHPRLNVNVTGFADHRGSDQYNLNLAGQRAKRIQELLVERGVDVSRVSLDAKGEQEILSPPGDAANYVLDRRVTIELSVAQEENFPVATNSEIAQ